MSQILQSQKKLISSIMFVGASLFATATNAAVVVINQRLDIPITYSGNVLGSYFNIGTSFKNGDTVILNYSFGDNYTGHVINPSLVLAEAWDSAFAGQVTTSSAKIDFVSTTGTVLHSAISGASSTRLAGQFDSLATGSYAFSNIRAQFQVSGLSSSTYTPHYGYFALLGNNINFTAAAPGTPLPVPIPVPEPESYAMILAGLAVVSALAKHKSKGMKPG